MLHSRLAAGAVALLLLLTSLATWSGLQAVAAQREALHRVVTAQEADVAAVAKKYTAGGDAGGDAGYAAYSTPHLTMDPPSDLAFAALGKRDIQPYSLRVRLLGLHSQLYESESVNPDMAAAGRYDFAFVLVYLAPLFVIALMHDLVTSERESGRLRLLQSLPERGGVVWRRRIMLRFVLLLASLLVPFGAGALVSGASASGIAVFAAATALYLAFWFGLATVVAARARTSAAAAAILLAAFVVLTLVTPTVVNAVIVRVVPVSKGVELSLAQRQAVHEGWDIPKPVTFAKFFRNHPEWKDTPPVTGRFHWKWYYAMHQVGDEAVADKVRQYRGDMLLRETWTNRAGLLLASVNVQALLHSLARSDLQAQLDYQDQVSRFHTRLRTFFYPYIFEERQFGPAEFAALPQYTSSSSRGENIEAMLALAVLAAGMALAGVRAARRPAI